MKIIIIYNILKQSELNLIEKIKTLSNMKGQIFFVFNQVLIDIVLDKFTLSNQDTSLINLVI